MRILTVVMAAAISLSATTALAEESVGEVWEVDPGASVSGQVGDRKLTDETELFDGDRVATGADGLAQLLFDGRTIVALAANTSLDINKFRGDAAKERITLSLLGGSMRVVVGESGEKYAFQAGFANVIPLGTAFDLTALPNGGAELVLLEGEVTLCGEGDDCKTVEESCGMLRAEPGQKVEEIEAGNERVQEIRKNFPFQTSESSLREEFQFPGLGCADDPGGLAPLALDAQVIGVGVGTASAIILCIVLCLQDSTSTIDTNNSTN